MIIYDTRKWCGVSILCHQTGSMLFSLRTLPFAIVSGVLALLPFFVPQVMLDFRNGSIYFSSVSFFISFAVVYRCQLSYGRYMTALSGYRQTASKLLDLAVLTRSFVISNSEEARLFKGLMMRWLKLYHKLCLSRLHGDRIKDMSYSGLMTAGEIKVLRQTRERHIVVGSWIQRTCIVYRHLFEAAPPPAFSRIFQFLSDSNQSMTAALEIAETPFPFPFAQVCSVCVFFWALVTPFALSAWIGEPVLCFLVAFMSTWILFSLNESASCLESPFSRGNHNDLPVLYFDFVFDDNLAMLAAGPDPELVQKNICTVGNVARGNESPLRSPVQSPVSREHIPSLALNSAPILVGESLNGMKELSGEEDEVEKELNGTEPSRSLREDMSRGKVRSDSSGAISDRTTLLSAAARLSEMRGDLSDSNKHHHSLHRAVSSEDIRLGMLRTDAFASGDSFEEGYTGKAPSSNITLSSNAFNPLQKAVSFMPTIPGSYQDLETGHSTTLDGKMQFSDPADDEGTKPNGKRGKLTKQLASRKFPAELLKQQDEVFGFTNAAKQMATSSSSHAGHSFMRQIKKHIGRTMVARNRSHLSLSDILVDKNGNPTALRARGTFSIFE